MTYRHRAGVRPYTSTYVFARSCVFDKQLLLPIYCDPLTLLTPSRAPLIANLRGHFAEFLNQYSPERLSILNPPTCVSFSTVQNKLSFEAFLGRYSCDFNILVSRLRDGLFQPPDHIPIAVPLRTCLEPGNINPVSIVYALRPRLRYRLTLGGFTFPRKP